MVKILLQTTVDDSPIAVGIKDKRPIAAANKPTMMNESLLIFPRPALALVFKISSSFGC